MRLAFPGQPQAVRYIEQAAPVTIGAGVTVTDTIDDTQLSGATVTISANFRTGDLLAAQRLAPALPQLIMLPHMF